MNKILCPKCGDGYIFDHAYMSGGGGFLTCTCGERLITKWFDPGVNVHRPPVPIDTLPVDRIKTEMFTRLETLERLVLYITYRLGFDPDSGQETFIPDFILADIEKLKDSVRNQNG